MIKYYDGTVFNAGTNAIVNTINTVGVMGAGIALEFKLRYPEMYKDYKRKCDNKELNVGTVDYFKAKDEYLIVNFPTKAHFKYPSKLHWIEKGLQNFISTYKEYNISSIAFPRLGTGKGGLNWDEVKKLMEQYLSALDIEVVICLDENKSAEGRELEMINFINGIELDYLSKRVKLTKGQKYIILSNRPFNRFWLLSTLKGIGVKTYENIFSYIYDEINCKNNVEIIQQSFFD